MKTTRRAIIVRFSGLDKPARLVNREINPGKHKRKRIYGYHERVIKPVDLAGHRVWINSRSTDREIVDTFFHEMTHVLFSIMKIRLSPAAQERVCSWVGYSAKTHFTEMMPGRFARRGR